MDTEGDNTASTGANIASRQAWMEFMSQPPSPDLNRLSHGDLAIATRCRVPVCTRCTLRFSGAIAPAMYGIDEEEMEERLQQWKAKHSPHSPPLMPPAILCPTCGNGLTTFGATSIGQAMTGCYEMTQEHEFNVGVDSFTITTVTPRAGFLRDASVTWTVAEVLSSSHEGIGPLKIWEVVVPLRNAIRWTLYSLLPAMNSVWNIAPSPTIGLSIVLTWEGDETELVSLSDLPHPEAIPGREKKKVPSPWEAALTTLSSPPRRPKRSWISRAKTARAAEANEAPLYNRDSPTCIDPEELQRLVLASSPAHAAVGELLKACPSKAVWETIWPSVPAAPKGPMRLASVNVRRSPLYLCGRYTKTLRGVPQTTWRVPDEKTKIPAVNVSRGIMDVLGSVPTVASCVSDVVKRLVKSDEAKFSSAGREDADVRMLGSGRPWIVEVVNARIFSREFGPAKEIEDAINDPSAAGASVGVSVKDVHWVSGPQLETSLKWIRNPEMEKRKCYRALCMAATPIPAQRLAELVQTVDEQGGMPITQRTPMRVAHRRAILARERMIWRLRAELVNQRAFVLDLVTAGGTYIKEFVHGDGGRTKPSLSTLLGVPVMDIVQLDVTHVDVPWPPVTTSDPSLVDLSSLKPLEGSGEGTEVAEEDVKEGMEHLM